MADRTWEASVDTDPTDGNNWNPVGVPGVGDDVIFDDTAQDNCAGGDLTGNQVGSITRTDDCIITIGTSAADALDFDCNGIVEDAGSGTAYWNIQNTTEWNFYGTGTCYIDGIDNDALNIDASGATVYVGPIPATPAEFDTLITIDAGTVHLQAVTDQGAAITNLTVHAGVTDSESGWAVFRQYGGTHTQEAGGVVVYYGYGGKCIYNSNTALSANSYVYGSHELTFEENFRAVTMAAGELYAGAVLRDPHGRVTFTAPLELEGCNLLDVTLDLGRHRKYVVTDI